MRLKAALAAAGASPRKRHGQHFLLDDNLLAAIVRAAEPLDGKRVLEVGPGPGLLTRHLLGAGARVVGLEIDPLMHAVARDLMGELPPASLRWIEADALAGSRRLGPELAQTLGHVDAMVSNLPYNIAGPLLGALACHPTPPARQTVLVQREMGDRLTAQPGSRDYGPLAVLMALTSRVKLDRPVRPQSFWPPPRVESVVLVIEPLPDRPDSATLDLVSGFLAAAFHNRRKTLWNSVRNAPGGQSGAARAPEAWKTLRAEALDPVQLCALAHTWAGIAPGERHRPETGRRSH